MRQKQRQGNRDNEHATARETKRQKTYKEISGGRERESIR